MAFDYQSIYFFCEQLFIGFSKNKKGTGVIEALYNWQFQLPTVEMGIKECPIPQQCHLYFPPAFNEGIDPANHLYNSNTTLGVVHHHGTMAPLRSSEALGLRPRTYNRITAVHLSHDRALPLMPHRLIKSWEVNVKNKQCRM